jgi:PTS system nitrogen regulatory IIA component
MVPDLLDETAVLFAVPGDGKRPFLAAASEHAARLTGLPDREIFDALLQRERLGTTGIGHGVAIPHAKFAGLERLHGLFCRLERAIDFGSLDGAPVDLVFILLAPEEAGADHLKGLARVARVLRDPASASVLRQTRDAKAVVALFANAASPSRAA